MKSKIDLAFEVLNEYDYKMGKSAQEGLWIIHQMEEVFSEKKVKVSREVAKALDFLHQMERDIDELYVRLGNILFNQAACIPVEHMEIIAPLYKCKGRDLFNAIQYGYELVS